MLKHARFRTLRSRLILAFLAVVAIAMLVLVIVVPSFARAHELSVLEDRLIAEAQVVADYVLTELNQGQAANLDELAKRLGNETQSRITIIALDGAVLGESDQELTKVANHASRREVQEALASGRGVDIHRSETVGYDMLYVAVPIIRNGTAFGTARVALRLTAVDQLAGSLTRAILLAALGGSLLSVLVGVLAARTITRPLLQLSHTAKELSIDPTKATGVWLGGGPLEIVQLGQTLERMAKTIQESLRRIGAERDKLDAVLSNMTDGIVIVNPEGRVTRINRAAESLIETRAPTRAQGTLAEVLRDHELVALVEEVRNSPGPSRTGTRLLEWSHPPRFVRAIASRFGTNDAGETLLVLQDLSAVRRLETIRRDFVANVSHELRTPIAAIKAMVETLQYGAVEHKATAHDFLDRIQQETDGLHRMVEQLMELARLESGHVEMELRPVDASQLVESAVERMAAVAALANVILSADAQTGLPEINADADRIGQVLVNLIHNAIKFTPPGGKITVEAKPEHDAIVIAVSDTGAGIARELLPRIFERFYKTDRARAGEGTGLGLAIAKHTVELHAGKIWAESGGPGRGTTVYVRLPIAGGA